DATEQGDEVLARFQSTAGDAAPERLIIQWTAENFVTPGDPVTFQAVLQLNTPGGAPGEILFNYEDIGTGDARTTEGGDATVAIRDLAFVDADALTITIPPDAASPLAGTGK